MFGTKKMLTLALLVASGAMTFVAVAADEAKSDAKAGDAGMKMESGMKMDGGTAMGGAKMADDMPCCTASEKAGMTCGICDPSAKAELGKPAVNFSLSDADGKQHMLSDYAGKNVVLVWENPQCPISKRHMTEGTLNKLADQYKDKNVAVVAVDSSNYVTPDETKAAANEFHFSYPTLLNADGTIGKMYDAKTTPHVFIIDTKGTLVYNGAIDSDPSGSTPVAERTNYAAKALDELLSGKPVSTPETKPYGCTVKYKES